MSVRAPRGVTLIELIIALAVTGIVLTAAHEAVGVVIGALQRSRALRAAARGEAVRLTLARWLEAAALPDSGAAFDGVSAWRDGRASDTLRFVVLDAGPLHPGPHHLALWVEDGHRPDTTGLMAAITPWPAGGHADTLVVAAGATSLDVRYLVADGGVERWVADWRSHTRLPYAIALQVAIGERAGSRVAGGDAALTAPLVVPIAASRW